MALPVILGVVAAVSATGGVSAGIRGGMKMKKANATNKSATAVRDEAIKEFELQNSVTASAMDDLGKLELEICAKFQEFADVLEMIQGRPEFKEYSKNGVNLPEYNPEQLKKVSVGASVILGGMGGAALGTAGGFAASGATTAAVMALGTASTGTAIASLSGVAATNATLAALGGGAIAAGGGGMALGTTMLGVSTAGVGLLIGGIIFNITGSGLSKKADEAYYQALKIKHQVERINKHLVELQGYSQKYYQLLSRVNEVYEREFSKLKTIVVDNNKTHWNDYSDNEKTIVYNCVLLVGLLYKMCKVNLVEKGEEINAVNRTEVDQCMDDVTQILNKQRLDEEE